MKISGFTIIRNGVKFDFPFTESLRSLLPLVDELVVVVGHGDDATLEKIKDLAEQHTKIKVFTSVWDETLRTEGRILAQQTDLAISYCQGDWGIYLQADEVIHEADYSLIKAAINKADAVANVDGLLFRYLHFYGSYSIINRNPSAYRNEVRAIKLRRKIFSFRDAQGFRKRDEQGNEYKLNVLGTEARIFHYGWVRPQIVMQAKTEAMDRFYHPDHSAGTGENYRYKRIFGLEHFSASHPAVMRERIQAGKNWEVNLFDHKLIFTLGDIRKFFTYYFEKFFGFLPFEYRNYKRVGKC
jgi:glycosyltransferase involved in cell wall biosynthesis